MPDNSNLLTEEQLEQLEGQLVPVDVEAPSPGKSAPSVPFLGGSGSTAPFFSGSLPPQFQLDSAFSTARVLSDRVPKNALMPFGIQSNPSTNAAIQSTAKNVVLSSVDIDTDQDTPIVNLQTGTSYTIQQSDLNKLISINNAAGGTIYLPPVTNTVTVALNNFQHASGGFFNGGNTTSSGSGPFTSTSTATWTATGSPLNAGDILMLALRLTYGPTETATFQMADNQNGIWSGVSQGVHDAVTGTDSCALAYIVNQKTVPIGSSLTLTLVVTYSLAAHSPSENGVFNMTGLKSFVASAQASAAAPNSAYTFGTNGLSITSPSTFISVADELKGGLSADQPDVTSGGLPWARILTGATAIGAAYLLGATNATIKEVWHATGSTNDAWGSVLAEFSNATASDVQQFTNNFFCYVENKGVGTFSLVSSLPIDGVSAPVTLATNQGALLFYDSVSNAWYTVRGIGGGANVVTAGAVLTNNQLVFGAGLETIKVGDLTGDATTSGTGAVSVVKVNGGSIPVSDLLVGTNGSGQFVLGATAVNAQSGTTYTIADTDRLKVITTTNSSAMAITLPQAGASSQFVAGWYAYLINRGTGIATVTPTTSTINGNTTLVLQKNQAVILVSDGTNYVALGTLLGDQNTTLTDGYLMAYDGTNHKWFAIAPSAISGINAVQLRGINIAVSAATPANQDVLQFNSTNNDWEPVLLDGLLHGDSVWPNDSAWSGYRDDFLTYTETTFNGTTINQAGQMGWILYESAGAGTGTNLAVRGVGGQPPYIGQITWENSGTVSANGLLILPGGFLTGLLTHDVNAMALLENPGWKATWVWKLDGAATTSAGSQTAFDATKKSIYIGFTGATVGEIMATSPVVSRPRSFLGLRYDTAVSPPGNASITPTSVGAGTGVYNFNALSPALVVNTLVGLYFNCSGFGTAANNGVFQCTANGATSVTLNNPSSANSGTMGTITTTITRSITSVANASGGTTVYTFASDGAPTNAYVGMIFVTSGFSHSVNNGTFGCTASTATTITLTNSAGVSDTTGTAVGTPLADGKYTFEFVNNPQYTSLVRSDVPGQTFPTTVAPTSGGWHRLDITCSAAGVVTLTLDGSATNTVTFTVTKQTNTSAVAATTVSSKSNVGVFTYAAGAGPTGTASVPDIAPGATITITGLTGAGNTTLNGTWNTTYVDTANSRVFFDTPAVADFGPNATSALTFTSYPSLAPIFLGGNDTTAAPTAHTMRFFVDYFSFVWNHALVDATNPDKTKARYW